jgi:hypothetical protein
MESVPSGITIPIEFNTQYGTRIVAIPHDWLTGTCVANCITDCGFNKDDTFIYSVPVMVDDSIIEWIKEYLATRPSCFTFKVRIDEPRDGQSSCDPTFSYIDTRVLVKCDFYTMNTNPELCASMSNILGDTEFTQVFTTMKALDFLGVDPIVNIVGWRYQYYGSESNEQTTPCVPMQSTPKRKQRRIYGSKKYEQSPLDQYYEDMEPENPHPFDEEDARSGAEMQRMYHEFMAMSVADGM